MRLQRLSLSLFGAVAVVSVVLAVGHRVAVPHQSGDRGNAVNEGDVSPLVRDLAEALVNALRGFADAICSQMSCGPSRSDPTSAPSSETA